MCGSVGCLRFGGLSSEILNSLGEATGTLSHRGPDGSALWTDPSGRCAFGHTRLAVIDLETGDQPQHSEDGRLHLIYNGEIYNYRELREELEGLGHAFRTESDTEVLLHGFRQWGEALPGRLNGMFAFAVWDEERERLTLVRDRAGQKPLYLYEDGGFRTFASEPKAIDALEGLHLEIDPSTIPLYLSYGYVPTPRTPYRRLRKVPAGTLCTIDRDGTREERYWRIRMRPEPIGEEEAREEVGTRLQAAVGRRLVSDVPLGAFLSGGLDSTVVVALMRRLTDAPVRTFSIGFEGEPAFDETAHAELVAQRLDTEHTTFRVGPGQIDLLDRLVALYDEPFGDSSALPTWILSRLTREQVTVALTGDGGDEVFGGYWRFRAAQVAGVIPRPVGAVAAGLSRLIPFHPDFRSAPRRIARFLAALGLPESGRLLHWMPYFGERLDEVIEAGLRGADPSTVRESLEASARSHSGSSALGRTMAVNFETYLPDDLLVKADRCSMAHGLELRAPFLDHELVRAAGRLPDRLKIRGRVLKYILRETSRELVPARILKRPKRGFAVPLASWLRGPWRPLLEERLMGSGARIYRWLSPEAVRGMAERHLGGTTDESHRLWSLLTLETWLQQRHDRARGGRS